MIPLRPLLALPRRAIGRNGPTLVQPNDPAYAEIGRIDPHGSGVAHSVIEPGRAVQLSPRVWRVTAPNGGVMTGPGTNSYFIGGGTSERWTLLDPGPDNETHIAALKAAAPGPVDRIVVTHTHRDHSPAAAPLRAVWGATVYGRSSPGTPGHEPGFAPDVVLSHGDRLDLGGGGLRVLHTPGHTANHLCYLLEEEKMLFTGDHVMQGATVVVSPPDGDMAAYFDSLTALLDEDLHWLAPGHGFLMAQPHEVVRVLLRHRRLREAKIVGALSGSEPASIDMLMARTYSHLPDALRSAAERSLHAHLLKLEAEGAVSNDGTMWQLNATS